MVIIVFGLPGSGKSYFASRLAKIITADYINSDEIRKELFKNRTYSTQEKAAVYNKMLAKMKEAVHQNRSIMLDATFHKDATRKTFVKELNQKGGIDFIEVLADENITRERLTKERKFSEANFEIYELIRQQNEPLDEPHLILKSTNNNIDEMLQKATNYLKLKDDKRTDK